MRSTIQSIFAGMPPLAYAAIGVGAIGIVIAVQSTQTLISAAGLPSEVPSLGEDGKKALAEHESNTKDRVAQIKGRSAFFVPPAPPPTIVHKPKDPEKPKPPPAPSKPSSYGGPAMFAIINDTVWFADGKKLKVGEGDKSVKVVSLEPPWSARLAYEGVEFDVSLFDRDKVIYPRPGEAKLPESKPEAKPETKPEAKPEAKPSDKPADKPADAHPEKQPDKPADPKADPKLDPKADPKADPKTGPATDPKADPKPADSQANDKPKGDPVATK